MVCEHTAASEAHRVRHIYLPQAIPAQAQEVQVSWEAVGANAYLLVKEPAASVVQAADDRMNRIFDALTKADEITLAGCYENRDLGITLMTDAYYIGSKRSVPTFLAPDSAICIYACELIDRHLTIFMQDDLLNVKLPRVEVFYEIQKHLFSRGYKLRITSDQTLFFGMLVVAGRFITQDDNGAWIDLPNLKAPPKPELRESWKKYRQYIEIREK